MNCGNNETKPRHEQDPRLDEFLVCCSAESRLLHEAYAAIGQVFPMIGIYALYVSAHPRITGPIVLAAFMVYTTRLAGGHGGRTSLETELRRLHVARETVATYGIPAATLTETGASRASAPLAANFLITRNASPELS